MTRTVLALVISTAFAATASAAPIGAQLVNGGGGIPEASSTLSYMGGPVLSHVNVVTVYWGNGVQFPGTGATGLDGFYTSVIQSAYYDWLIEYKTPSQTMGRGTFGGTYNYTTGKSGAITDANIQTGLSSLIDGGMVPAPTPDTLYAIHFAPGISITMSDGSKSCSVFCAYHSSYAKGSTKVYYSVNPDQGGSCAGGCGNDPSLFNNTTSVASHELVEATTDPDVGENNVAWYNNSQGEIGDICNAQQGKIGNYVVQKEWSNSQNACIVTNPNVMVNDFSVATASTTLTVAPGGMTTTMLTLTKTVGSAENVMLTATAPTGLTVAFAPTSATSGGGTSTITVSAAPTATPGMSEKFTIKAAGSSASHTLDVTVMVTTPPDMAMPADMAQPVNNGGSGGTGGGGGDGTGGGGGTGTGGNGTGGNGNNGGGKISDSGCSIGGGNIVGSWALAGLVLLGLAFRRRRA